MRPIKYIVFHCTDTPMDTTVESIQNYWKNHLKWKYPGYHYIIKADGEIKKLLSTKIPSNGVLGYNEHCINIAYIGGKTKAGKHGDTRTPAQQHAMFNLLIRFLHRYKNVEVKGHCEFPNQGGRTCPNFNVKEWLKNYTPDLREPLSDDSFLD